MTVLNIDRELLSEFISEAKELLAPVDNLFLELEKKPDDLNIVNAIFRPVHTIKGNSAYFGLMGVRNLTHEMETLLDGLRKEKLSVTPRNVQLLLTGMDRLKNMLSRVEEGEDDVLDEAELDNFILKLKKEYSGESAPSKGGVKLIDALEILEEKVGAYDETALDAIIQLKEIVLSGNFEDEAISEDELCWPPVAEILEYVHRWRESEPTDGIMDVFKGKMQDLIALLEEECSEAVEAAREMISDFETLRSAMGYDELLIVSVEEKSRLINSIIVEQKGEELCQKGSGKTAEQSDNKEMSESDRSIVAADDVKNTSHKTMRVAEAQIDEFLAYVGELLVVGDMFEHLQSRIVEIAQTGGIHEEFKLANGTFKELSDKLQHSIMDLRRVPARKILQKAPRIAYDVAVASGKEIKVELFGEDLRIDKRHAELIDAPLTHMVRNSADHGIESPEERSESGKKSEGIIKIGLEQSDQEVIFTVIDDGRGLDLERIEDKAQELGIISSGQTLREQDIVDLIFTSGISTADTVTDVSGRGVGMNVVKESVEKAGGHISIKTNPGQGSQFKIVLPRTVSTQIIHGYIVDSEGQSFVLPMESVLYSANISTSKMVNIAGKGLCIEVHNNVLRCVDLHCALGGNSTDYRQKESVLIVGIEAAGEEYAMLVDNVLGIKKVVKRSIDGLEFDGMAGIVDGAALQGDGTISVILSPTELVKASGRICSDNG